MILGIGHCLSLSVEATTAAVTQIVATPKIWFRVLKLRLREMLLFFETGIDNWIFKVAPHKIWQKMKKTLFQLVFCSDSVKPEKSDFG